MIASFVLCCSPLVPQTEHGFVPLFDGRTLDGWTTRGGRYDGNASWSVEDGALVGRPNAGGEGGLLYTARAYTSFVLRLDAKLDYPFDSGVFVRMAPEGRGAQITLDHREGGEIGAIYSDGFLMHNERGSALFRPNDWNELEVRCTGFDLHLVFTLNGETITDYKVRSGQFGGGYASAGLIGLQVHGGGGDEGEVRFRNVRIRELPVFGDELFEPADPSRPEILAPTSEAATAGWRSMFDGKSLAGWKVAGRTDRYLAKDGVLTFLARDGAGELQTDEDFTDFRLCLEFKIARMANSGIFLRAARDGSNPAFSGCEIQILDDFNWEVVTGTRLEPWQFTGSLYGSVSPGDRSALRALGAWNLFEIQYQGPRLAVALNGRTLYDVDTLAIQSESGEPFAKRVKTGFIGLQHHGSEHVASETTVEFRNLFVQPLPL